MSDPVKEDSYDDEECEENKDEALNDSPLPDMWN